MNKPLITAFDYKNSLSPLPLYIIHFIQNIGGEPFYSSTAKKRVDILITISTEIIKKNDYGCIINADINYLRLIANKAGFK